MSKATRTVSDEYDDSAHRPTRFDGEIMVWISRDEAPGGGLAPPHTKQQD